MATTPTLHAVPPKTVKRKKPRILLSGPSGCGKTMLSLSFPRPYFFDHENSATFEQYQDQLAKSAGVYFGKKKGSQDFQVVINETKALCVAKHPYLTAVYDSTSSLTDMEAAVAAEKYGTDYGRDKKEAYKSVRQLLRWVEDIDMAVVFIAHQKPLWQGEDKNRRMVGYTYDGYEKLEYILDLWLEMQEINGERMLCVRKSRIDSLPKGTMLKASYLDFAALYGKDIIETESQPIVLATPDDVKQLSALLESVIIDPKKTNSEIMQDWLLKAGVETPNELSQEVIQKCIKYIQSKMTKGEK